MNIVSATKKAKRKGRGIGSRGAKSGKGQKGQKSRAGYSKKIGHEGGQTPLYMRLPKSRGSLQKFASQAKKPLAVTTTQLSRIAAKGKLEEVGPEQLLELGFLKKKSQHLKIIAGGDLKGKFTVKAHQVSKGAQKILDASDSTLELIKLKKAETKKETKSKAAPKK